MRILLASNRLFVSGGPERYLFNVLPALRERGHAVVPFALRYRDNVRTESDSLFPDPPAGTDFVRHGDRILGLSERLSLAGRVIFNRAVYNKAVLALEHEGIDVVYALQIAHYLFPEVIQAAWDKGVPVVWRQSDFQLICPAYNGFRDGGPCTDCDRSWLPALRHRCLKGSLAVTGARVAAMAYARWSGADRRARLILCPSRFLATRLIEAGMPRDRIRTLATPVDPAWLAAPDATEKSGSAAEPYFLYAGGLYEPKGVQVAMRAAARASLPLVVAGDTSGEFARGLLAEAPASVRFTGAVDDVALRTLYAGARAVIVPSLWYENMPNVVLEAQASGRAVIASDLGSLPEIVVDGTHGLLFKPGDSDALAWAMRRLWDDSAEAVRMGRVGRERVERHHRMDRHVEELEALLRSVCV